MRLSRLLNLVLALVIGNAGAFLPDMLAQTPGDNAYQERRQKASELFAQGRRLEALPLVEELVVKNPKDDQMLVALAACLVDHAATLSDQEAAAKERFRARDLLDQAWNLGNTSPLAQNLAHLLKELPQNGTIKFSDNAIVDEAIRSGEAAFARREFAEAIKNYAKALALEPGNYSAILFTAHAYDKQNDSAKAKEWYERTIQLHPDVETAYRYYADMLAKQGNMGKARTMLIRAAVAEPYNRMVWRELNAWATINKTQINSVIVSVPAPAKERSLGNAKPDQSAGSGLGPTWQAYWDIRDRWRDGDSFKRRYPQETQYRHSLPEESEALTTTAQLLQKLKLDTKRNVPSPADPSADLLLKLQGAGLIEAYVLFSLGDDGIAHDYAAYRANHRAKLEEYMDKFVVPPTPH